MIKRLRHKGREVRGRGDGRGGRVGKGRKGGGGEEGEEGRGASRERIFRRSEGKGEGSVWGKF